MKSNLSKEEVKMIFGICHFIEVGECSAVCKDKSARNFSQDIKDVDCETCKKLKQNDKRNS